MKKTIRDATMYTRNGIQNTEGAVLADSDLVYPGSENKGSVSVTHPASPSASDALCGSSICGPPPPSNPKQENVAVIRQHDPNSLGQTMSSLPNERVAQPRPVQEPGVSLNTPHLSVAGLRRYGPLICAKFPRLALLD